MIDFGHVLRMSGKEKRGRRNQEARTGQRTQEQRTKGGIQMKNTHLRKNHRLLMLALASLAVQQRNHIRKALARGGLVLVMFLLGVLATGPAQAAT